MERKVQLAIELYEAARATRPGWPDEATRRADFEAHLRLRALLDRADEFWPKETGRPPAGPAP